MNGFHNWRKLLVENAETVSKFNADETPEKIIMFNIAAEFAFVSASNFESASVINPQNAERFVVLMANQRRADRLTRQT